MALIEQQEDKEQEIYSNFINSLKAQITKENYEINVKYYLNFCNFTKFSELLTIQEPQKQIIKYIMSLRERGLELKNQNSVPNNVNGNDISVQVLLKKLSSIGIEINLEKLRNT